MTFKEKLQHKYALSEQGAKDMIHAFISATISNIVLMFPVGMLYLLVKNYMEGTLKEKGIIPVYTSGAADNEWTLQIISIDSRAKQEIQTPGAAEKLNTHKACLLYTSPSPRD